MLQDSVERLFVGVLSVEAMLYVWDQCLLVSRCAHMEGREERGVKEESDEGRTLYVGYQCLLIVPLGKEEDTRSTRHTDFQCTTIPPSHTHSSGELQSTATVCVRLYSGALAGAPA